MVAPWLGLRQPETLAPERRIRVSVSALLNNSVLIVRHAKVMAYTLAAGLMFGALLLYLSTAQALFLDLYRIADLFPLYFAVLASGVGLSSYVNGRLVMRYGMHRLSVIALLGMMGFGSALLGVALLNGGVPSFVVFMLLCFGMFGCLGILFSNLNAMAMENLGRVAGLGASVVSSLSSLVAVMVAVAVGRFYDQTVVPLTAGFILAGLLSLALVLGARRSTAGDI